MGFLLRTYNDDRVTLEVAFRGNKSTDSYAAVDNIQSAIDYFDLYIKDNTLFRKTSESKQLDALEQIMEQTTNKLHSLLSNLSNEEAINNIELYPNWQPGIHMEEGERYSYNGQLYFVNVDHYADSNITPDTNTELYTLIIA